MIRQIVELPCDFAPLCTIPRTHRCQYLALGILPPRWPCERMRSQHWARIAFLRSKKCQIFAKGESFIADLNKIVSSSHAAIRTVPKAPRESRLLAVGGQNRARRGISTGGNRIRTSGTAEDARLVADLYAHDASRRIPKKGSSDQIVACLRCLAAGVVGSATACAFRFRPPGTGSKRAGWRRSGAICSPSLGWCASNRMLPAPGCISRRPSDR